MAYPSEIWGKSSLLLLQSHLENTNRDKAKTEGITMTPKCDETYGTERDSVSCYKRTKISNSKVNQKRQGDKNWQNQCWLFQLIKKLENNCHITYSVQTLNKIDGLNLIVQLAKSPIYIAVDCSFIIWTKN